MKGDKEGEKRLINTVRRVIVKVRNFCSSQQVVPDLSPYIISEPCVLY